jgi:putative nucleotidyltransferase with HDIG domain
MRKISIQGDFEVSRLSLEECTNVINGLPPLSSALNRLLSALENDMAGANDIARIISFDQALSANILRLVNSAYYGYPNQITSIDHAVVILGFNAIKSLALGLAVVNIFTEKVYKESKKMHFWEHSLGTAVASRLLMSKINKNYSEEAFTAGLLHDIGKMVFLLSFKDDYVKLYDEAKGDSNNMQFLESEAIGADHAKVGTHIAKKWCFPSKLCAMIQYHHTPEKLKDFDQMTVITGCIVYMANWVSHMSILGKKVTDCPSEKFFQLKDILKIPDELLNAIHSSLNTHINEIKRFFNMA